MSVSLRVAKKRRVEAAAAAFADPDDDVEPTLTTEEEDKQVQKLKVPGLYIYALATICVSSVTAPHHTGRRIR